MPVKLKLMHVKKLGQISREIKNFPAKTRNFLPLKMNFLPVRKMKKNKNEKKSVKIKVGVKKLKNGPKSGREIVFLPVKKLKKGPKMAFTGTFFFHGKKKN